MKVESDSLGLACGDIPARMTKETLHFRCLLSCFVVGCNTSPETGYSDWQLSWFFYANTGEVIKVYQHGFLCILQDSSFIIIFCANDIASLHRTLSVKRLDDLGSNMGCEIFLFHLLPYWLWYPSAHPPEGLFAGLKRLERSSSVLFIY